MTRNAFRIVQMTDLHLMDLKEDTETFSLIKNTVTSCHPDLIVITGDLTMIHENQKLLIQLRELMDSFGVLWTVVFGNHDHECTLSLDEQADLLMKGKYCLFEKGNVNLRGVGNHYITLTKGNQNIALLGFLDSHNSRIDEINGENIWSYDYIDKNQIQDAILEITALKNSSNLKSSIFFFHIPLVEFKQILETNKSEIEGSCYEEVCSSNYDSGFFDEVNKTNTLKGIFVGHDHVNDYSFKKEGCLLAYGRCTGHYNYTMPEFKKGARIIDINDTGSISSYVITE